MNVIAPRALRAFWRRHPHAEEPLRIWLKLMRQSNYRNWGEIKSAFPSADYLGNEQLAIFNIGCNKYRLIVDISFNENRIFIKRVYTHAEYDKWNKGGRK